jgi:uncharacterized Tic20 family protein
MNTGFSEDEWRESAEGSPSFHFEKGGAKKTPSFDPDPPVERAERESEQTREWRSAEPAPPKDGYREGARGANYNEARNPNYGDHQGQAAGGISEQEDRQWAMLSHAAGAVATLFSVGVLGWAAPLAIWLIRREEGGFASSQAKEAFNFQLTMIIGYCAGAIAFFTFIGIPIAFVIWVTLWIVNLIWSIQGAIRTHSGQDYSYPWNLRLL